MSLTLTVQPAQLTQSGIRQAVEVQANDTGQSAWIEIYAKPCSPYAFVIRHGDYDGREYCLQWNEALPIAPNFDLENITHIGAMANWVKDLGNEIVREPMPDTGMTI